MQNTPANDHYPDWLPLSRLLLEQVNQMGAQLSRSYSEETDDDLQKLIAAGAKLKDFNDAVIQQKFSDPDKIWHDLRNILGTIIGYCELIDEETSYLNDHSLKPLLHKLLVYSQQLLELGEAPSQDSRTTQPIIAASTHGTILVVDDQQESREILRRYLQQSQHQVFEAAGGREMFKLLHSKVIDLILLDLILPEMDGDELLQQLKQNDALRAIPVIVVSGNKDTERVIRCIEAGAEDYLFKPFNPALLQARISAGVERKLWHDKEKLYRQELERNQTFIRKVFGRYLSEEIVATLLEDPDGLDMGGTQRKVSVLMADIRGFTTIAEQLSPQRVVRLLNNYLGTMSEIIMKYNGTVDEFIGDAILAIFGAPITRENDTDRAISCAIEMQAAISEINQRNRAENLPEITIGISINTGLVVAGNIGSEKRTKYGVVGHTVNQTARIEEHCGPDSILISEATLNDSKATLQLGETKTITAKGILKAIKIFELHGIKSPTSNTDSFPTVAASNIKN